MRISVVARVPCPQAAVASSIVIWSSLTWMKTGVSEAPSTMMASQPANLMRGPSMPPQCESTTRWSLVNVDSDAQVMRPPSGMPEAVSGPTAYTILLSGENGSVPAGTSSYMILLARPMPPTRNLYGSVDSTLTAPVVRLTRAILPVQPYETLSSAICSLPLPNLAFACPPASGTAALAVRALRRRDGRSQAPGRAVVRARRHPRGDATHTFVGHVEADSALGSARPRRPAPSLSARGTARGGAGAMHGTGHARDSIRHAAHYARGPCGAMTCLRASPQSGSSGHGSWPGLPDRGDAAPAAPGTMGAVRQGDVAGARAGMPCTPIAPGAPECSRSPAHRDVGGDGRSEAEGPRRGPSGRARDGGSAGGTHGTGRVARGG